MTKIKNPNKVRFWTYTDGTPTRWFWTLTAPNRAVINESKGYRDKADMLHNLALVHGRELAAGDTVINGRQHNAWRWDLDAALLGIGLQPYAETYSKDQP